MSIKNLNRAFTAASEADRDDREYRGVGGHKASRARKVAARRAARRACKAVTAYEVEA
jgi:hypothetical protein